MSAHASQRSSEAPTATSITTALFVTDSGGVLPLGTRGQAHVFDSEEGSALCGHPSTASHERERVADASHDHHVVGDTRVCGNCSRIIRSRIAAGELSSGDDQLDLLLRADAGEEIVVEAGDTRQMVEVEDVDWGNGRVRVSGEAVDVDHAGYEYSTDGVRLTLVPGTDDVEAVLAGNLLDDRDHDSASVSRPLVADGGPQVARRGSADADDPAAAAGPDEHPLAAYADLPDPADDPTLAYCHPGKQYETLDGSARVLTVIDYIPDGPDGLEGIVILEADGDAYLPHEFERDVGGVTRAAVAEHVPDASNRAVYSARGLIRAVGQLELGEVDAWSYDDLYYEFVEG